MLTSRYVVSASFVISAVSAFATAHTSVPSSSTDRYSSIARRAHRQGRLVHDERVLAKVGRDVARGRVDWPEVDLAPLVNDDRHDDDDSLRIPHRRGIGPGRGAQPPGGDELR